MFLNRDARFTSGEDLRLYPPVIAELGSKAAFPNLNPARLYRYHRHAMQNEALFMKITGKGTSPESTGLGSVGKKEGWLVTRTNTSSFPRGGASYNTVQQYVICAVKVPVEYDLAMRGVPVLCGNLDRLTTALYCATCTGEKLCENYRGFRFYR